MKTKLTLDTVKSVLATTADGTVTSAQLAASAGVNLQTASRFLTSAVDEGTMYVAGTVKTGKRGRPAGRFALTTMGLTAPASVSTEQIVTPVETDAAPAEVAVKLSDVLDGAVPPMEVSTETLVTPEAV